VNDRYSSNGNKFPSRCGLFNAFLFLGLLHIAKWFPYPKVKIADTRLGFFFTQTGISYLVFTPRQRQGL